MTGGRTLKEFLDDLGATPDPESVVSQLEYEVVILVGREDEYTIDAVEFNHAERRVEIRV